MNNKKLTYDRLTELLHYDPLDGKFSWIIGRPSSVAGDIAGTVNDKGYIVIGIDKAYYRAHRLAYLYMIKSFPSTQIDHINGDKSDNRWINLRTASNQENQRNTRTRKNNTTGLHGVIVLKKNNTYLSSITVDGKTKHLYQGNDLFEACCTRKSAEYKIGFHKNHGR